MEAGRKLDAAPVRTPAAASGASVSRSVASVLASRRGRKRRSCRALMLLHEPAAVDLADESVILGRAMSLENVELVRQLYEAAERRDLETLEMLGSEEREFHSVLAASEGRVFRGRQGIRDYFAAIDAAFDDWQPEIEESSTAPAGWRAARAPTELRRQRAPARRPRARRAPAGSSAGRRRHWRRASSGAPARARPSRGLAPPSPRGRRTVPARCLPPSASFRRGLGLWPR